MNKTPPFEPSPKRTQSQALFSLRAAPAWTPGVWGGHRLRHSRGGRAGADGHVHHASDARGELLLPAGRAGFGGPKSQQ